MIADRNGTRVAYEVRASGKPTLVFVHGLAANRHTWDGITSQLAQRYTTVTVDLPGHGESYTGNPPDKDEFVLDVRAVVEQVGTQPVVIVGWSLGGRIACEFAIDYPQQTAGIVLVDHNPPQVARSQPNGDEISKLLEKHEWPIAAAKLVESWIGGAESDVAGLRAQLSDMVLKTDPNVVREIRGGPWKRRIDYSLVGVPTLLIQGGSSPIGGQSSIDYLVAEIPQCEVRVIDGHGHAVHVSAPDETSRAIDAFVMAHCVVDN